MQNINIGVIAVVLLAAIALVMFLVVRNRKDRKKLLPPQGTDGLVTKEKMDQLRDQDKI